MRRRCSRANCSTRKETAAPARATPTERPPWAARATRAPPPRVRTSGACAGVGAGGTTRASPSPPPRTRRTSCAAGGSRAAADPSRARRARTASTTRGGTSLAGARRALTRAASASCPTRACTRRRRSPRTRARSWGTSVCRWRSAAAVTGGTASGRAVSAAFAASVASAASAEGSRDGELHPIARSPPQSAPGYSARAPPSPSQLPAPRAERSFPWPSPLRTNAGTEC
mmetsp:Transcript_23772/g.77297  ORF Transcript_23772/g.77297 Transcript_23772/m.77297 type:complete len:229 (-) Transcript_23772:89-775(-)